MCGFAEKRSVTAISTCDSQACLNADRSAWHVRGDSLETSAGLPSNVQNKAHTLVLVLVIYCGGVLFAFRLRLSLQALTPLAAKPSDQMRLSPL